MNNSRIIDANELSKNVLKWMPKDSCGKQEKEFPFEQDIVVSMMMEIEEAPTVNPEELPIVQELRAEIKKLNTEIASREQASIEEHGEVHYWQNKARDLEKKLAIAKNAQGYWIHNPSMDDMYYSCYICSQCGQQVSISNKQDAYQAMPYCHCGAKMIKEGKE